MVKRILDLLSREISGLHEAAYLLAFFTLASQLLALVRDKLLAHSFGAGQVLDTYYAAFRIPDFLFITVGSIVSVSVLIPFLAERINKKEEEMKFANSIFTSFFVFIVLLSVLIFFTLPYFIGYVYPGFVGENLENLITLTRILLLSPIFLGLSNLFSSIIQVNKKFFAYAISPLLYNLGIIFGVIFFYPVFGIKGLAYGVVLGALMHWSIQIPIASRLNFLPKFTTKLEWGEIKRVALLSLPRTITMSANQIAFFFLISLASTMGVGAITVFSLAFNLQSVPLGIIGVSYSVAAFPTLARLFSEGERTKFLGQIVSATRHIIFLSLPVIVLFIVLRAQIVRTIFGSGKFGWSDTKLTAACLALFVISVVAQSLILLFIRGYYAMGNTKRPLLINILSSSSIVLFVFVLTYLFKTNDLFKYFIEAMFRVDDVSNSIILMPALSYSIGSIINAGALMLMFQADFEKFIHLISKTFWQGLSASVIMGFVSYKFLGIFGGLLNLNTTIGIFMQGFLAGIIGLIIWAIILFVLNSRELKEVWRTLHRKIWLLRVIVPEQEVL